MLDAFGYWNDPRDWLSDLTSIDPYTGFASALGILAAAVGTDVDPYTAESLDPAKLNAFTSDRNGNPFTRDSIADSFTRSRESLLASPDLVASNGPLPSNSQQMSRDQVEAFLATHPDYSQTEIDGKTWVQFVVTLNGEPTYLYVRDQPFDWYTERAPGPPAPPSSPIDPPAPAAPAGSASTMPTAPQVTPPATQPSVTQPSIVAPPSTVSGGNQPADALSNVANSPLNYPDPYGAPPAPPVQAAPDSMTITEWAYPKPDHRLFQPVTHYDSGNVAGNFLLNKIILPWRNALAFYTNVPLALVVGVDDELRHSSDWAPSYQAFQDMMPLEGAMGLTMEVGPAIDFGLTWLSNNQTLGNAARAPVFWFMGAGGIGGGVGVGGALRTLPRVAPTTAVATERLPALAPEVHEVVSAVAQAPALPPPAVWEEAANRFHDSVRQAEAILNNHPGEIMNLGGRHTGAPVSMGQLGAASYRSAFARTLAGNAMEALVSRINGLNPIFNAGFKQVGGAYKIDFIGVGRFEGLSFELTTEAGVASHAGRSYVQAPGAMIFTYTLSLF